jgi:hypothetical protein
MRYPTIMHELRNGIITSSPRWLIEVRLFVNFIKVLMIENRPETLRCDVSASAMEAYASYCYSEVPRTAYAEDNLQNTPNYSNPSIRLLVRMRMIPFLPTLNLKQHQKSLGIDTLL